MKSLVIPVVIVAVALANAACGQTASPLPAATASHFHASAGTHSGSYRYSFAYPVPTATARPAPTSTALPAPTPVRIQPRATRETGKAIDFEIETFGGETIKLSDFEGKVVVLNFWASWCPPCRWEMPFFERMSQEYEDQDVVFLGVAISDTLENVRAFAEGVGVTYPNGLDETGEIARDYSVVSLPTTFFIGKDGNVERRLSSAANEGVLKVFLRGQLRPRN